MYIYEIISIILGVGGLYIAGKIYFEKKAGRKMICPLHGNCEEVLNSDFAKMVGIPLEVAGAGYYLTIIAANILIIAFPFLKFSLLEVILYGATLAGFIFSVYLTSIQAFYLKNWCTWCLYSALFSILIFTTSTINFCGNLEPIIQVMKSTPWFFVLINIFAYALGASIALITEFLTLRFLKDFKIDQNEKMILMYLWQVLWAAIFLVIISGFAIFVFDIKVFDNQRIYLIKSLIFGFIVFGSILMSFFILPKLDKSKISCSVMHVRSTSFYRNTAIAFSTMLLISWLVGIFVNQVFYCTCSIKKNLMTYLIILFTSAISALIVFQYRDKKSLDKKK